MADSKNYAVVTGCYTKCTYYNINSKPMVPKDPEGPPCDMYQPRRGGKRCKYFFDGQMCTYFKEAK